MVARAHVQYQTIDLTSVAGSRVGLVDGNAHWGQCHSAADHQSDVDGLANICCVHLHQSLYVNGSRHVCNQLRWKLPRPGADPGAGVRWVRTNPHPSETKTFFETILIWIEPRGAEFGEVNRVG